MILTTHFVTGAAVASLTDRPVMMIIASLALHFLLDMLPHWEYIAEEFNSVGELKKYLPKLTVDILLGPLLVFTLFCYFVGFDSGKIFWLFLGGFFGIMPDGLTFLRAIFSQNKVLGRLYHFHCWIQPRKALNWQSGLLTQVIIIAVALWLVISNPFL
jgi:hypothetical protein